MARHDWYRRTTWTERDREEFCARNRRSRGDNSKAQYLRIQAQTLFETGDRRLIASALELLEQTLSEYPSAMDSALTYQCAGQCSQALGQTATAVGYYRNAIAREREFPGIRTNAAFLLGRVAVEERVQSALSEAVTAMESHGRPIFPWNAYILNGVLAFIASQEGRDTDAKNLAAAALEAAAIRDTGLGHGRGHLGTVRDVDTRFHAILRRIADA